jgi:hypothetical protein
MPRVCSFSTGRKCWIAFRCTFPCFQACSGKVRSGAYFCGVTRETQARQRLQGTVTLVSKHSYSTACITSARGAYSERFHAAIYISP